MLSTRLHPHAPSRRAAPIRSALLAAFASLGLCACDRPEADPTSALASLDALAFVPAGECLLLGRDGVEIACATRTALLVERYEVTRDEWQRWSGASAPDPEPGTPPPLPNSWPDAPTTWPASGMTLHRARAFARAHGMRLPTAAEWIRIAAGTRAQPWPWGLSGAKAVANTAELALGHPVPVGTFEQGATPDAIYDLLGNVAEWVEEPLPALAGDVDASSSAWAVGGSFATRLWKIHELDLAGRIVVVHVDLDPRTSARDIGLRCVVEARAWLAANAPELGATDRERDALRRIGARWGRDAVPLLEELSAAANAPSSLRLLLEGARG